MRILYLTLETLLFLPQYPPFVSNSYIDHSAELARFPIFSGLDEKVLRGIPAIKLPPTRAGTTFFKQGGPITKVYLILNGQVSLERVDAQGNVVLQRMVGPGDVFGRLELDTIEGQLGTAKAVTATEVLSIEKDVLVRLRTGQRELRNQLDRSAVIGHLRTTPYFAPLTDLEIKWISDIVKIESCRSKTVLYQRGDPGDSILVLRQGRVRLGGAGSAGQRWLSAGSVLGDRSAFEEGSRRFSSAVSESECHYYRLPAEDLRQVADHHPDSIWIQDPLDVERILQGAPLFGALNSEALRHLAGYTMQIHVSLAYYPVTRQGRPDNYYYILVNGAAIRQTENSSGELEEIAQLQAGQSFGEESVILGRAAPSSIETLSTTDWLRVHRQDLRLFLQDHPEAEEQLVLSDDLRDKLKGLTQERKWQQEGEVILMQTRRHWIVLLRNLGAVFGAYVFLIICNLAVSAVLTFPFGLQWLGPLAVICLPMPVAFWVILDYLNDWHIVTSRRLVHEEKVILISERRASAPLDKVQNLESKRSFLARLLSYGHLVINTAAEVGEIVFDFLPNTDQVTDLINREAARARAGVKAESEEVIRRQLQDRLHIGLEERASVRALIETPTFGKKKVKERRLKLPFKKFVFGVQEKPDNRVEWRKHWLALVIRTFWPFVLTMFSATLIVLVIGNVILQSIPTELQNVVALISLLMFMFGLFWFWWSWTDWDNDRYILTDKHIEHIEQKTSVLR